jgi:hypothetical protein
MSREEIQQSLCAYDKRNPYFVFERDLGSDKCMCFNCATGKTKLAEHILVMDEALSTTKKIWDQADKVTHEGFVYVKYDDIKKSY